MELVLELFLTAIVAVLFSFLVAKLVSMAMSGQPGSDSDTKVGADFDEAILMEELQFRQELRGRPYETEKRIEFVEETGHKVDRFQGEPVRGEDEAVKLAKTSEGVKTKGEDLSEQVKNGQSPEQVKNRESPEKVKDGETTEQVTNGEFPEQVKDGELPEQVKDDASPEQVQYGESLGNSSEETIVHGESESKGLVEKRNEPVAVEVVGDVAEKSEEIVVVETESKARNEERSEELDIEYEDDDWEGIERSELEKHFAAAAKFVVELGEKADLTSIGSDAQMELYGLHKIATEGPCREPQPMALMLSARAKWNAWQKLGNMSPEVAMEQYIALLTDRVPKWLEENSTAKSKLESAEAGTSGAQTLKLSPLSDHQTIISHGSSSGSKHGPKGGDVTEASSLDSRAKE